jgi:toxin CptA
MHYPFKPSLRFSLSLLLLHATAAAVASATDIALPAKLAVLLMVVLSLVYYLLRDALLLLPNSWREILLDQNDVSVTVRDGSGFTGQVSCKTVVSPYFVVLCLKPEGHRLLRSRVIFPDSMGESAFRGLCVHLRFS